MAEWWESLSVLQHMFLYAAIPFTLVLVIQAILTFIGLGGHDTDTGGDAHMDVHIDHADVTHDHGDAAHEHTDDPNMAVASFRFFTIRGIVAFFCIFGWTGYVLSATSLTAVPVIVIATAAGLLAMLLIGLMFYSVRRLQASGNIKYSNAVGKAAEVYLPIPAQRSGKGKVMVTVQDRFVEAEAVTDDEQKIHTGETVRVVGNMGNTLIVKK